MANLLPGGLRERLKDWVFWPLLDHVQVEITTACHNACTYCTRTAFRRSGAWPEAVMSVDLYRRILPGIARGLRAGGERVPYLHLQGWGEPLLHPDFVEMLRLAKQAGCRVGTTTGGRELNRDFARVLVDEGLDLIAFSVAGIDERNDAVRRGCRIADVFAGIDAIERARRDAGTRQPRVNVAYMLLRSDLDDVERIPETFAGRGVDAVVVSTLDYPASPDMRAEILAPADDAEYAALRARFDAVTADGRARGLAVEFHLPRPRPYRGVCIDRAHGLCLVVGTDAKVTPCILSRFTSADEAAIADGQFVFGDLTRENLREIWWKPEYVRFRRSFWDRRPPERCQTCPKLRMV